MTDRHLQVKEQELAQVMSEYLRFDMSELRRDIGLAVKAETERIEKESAEKV